MRIVPLAQQEEAGRSDEDVAQRRGGFRHPDHHQLPPPGHDFGDVVRIEAVLAADAQPHQEKTRDEPRQVGREEDQQRGRQHEERAEAEENQIALSVAPRPEHHRPDHDTHQARTPDEALRERTQRRIPDDLQHRQNDADERGERCAGKLPHRGDRHHAEVAPAQRHVIHVERFVGHGIADLKIPDRSARNMPPASGGERTGRNGSDRIPHRTLSPPPKRLSAPFGDAPSRHRAPVKRTASGVRRGCGIRGA